MGKKVINKEFSERQGISRIANQQLWMTFQMAGPRPGNIKEIDDRLYVKIAAIYSYLSQREAQKRKEISVNLHTISFQVHYILDKIALYHGKLFPSVYTYKKFN